MGMGTSPELVGRVNDVMTSVSGKNVMHTVLSGFRGRRFSDAHLAQTSTAIWSDDGLELQILRSSAYSKAEQSSGSSDGRGLIKIMKRVGPKTDPCGTPLRVSNDGEKNPLTRT